VSRAFFIAASAAGFFAFAMQAQTEAQARPAWCGTQKEMNAAERTVCADASLGALDDQLTMIYESALKSVGSERAKLQKTQEDWIRVTRNGCNDDNTCLRDVYDRRISIVRSIDNRGSIEPNGTH